MSSITETLDLCSRHIPLPPRAIQQPPSSTVPEQQKELDNLHSAFNEVLNCI
jgi:hypothetical protein